VLIVAILTSIALTGIHVYQASRRVLKMKAFKKEHGESFPVVLSSLYEASISPFVSMAIHITLSYFMFLGLFVGDESTFFEFWWIQLFFHLPVPVPFFIASFRQVYYFFRRKPWHLDASALISFKQVSQWQSIVRKHGNVSPEDKYRFLFKSTLDEQKILDERYIADILRASDLLVQQQRAEKEVSDSRAFLNVEIDEEVDLLNALNEELIGLFDSLLYAVGMKKSPAYIEEKKRELMQRKLNKMISLEKRIPIAEVELLKLVEDTDTEPEVKAKANDVLLAIKSRTKQGQAESKRELDMITIKTAMAVEGITEEDLKKLK